jgi:hypothetical protein
MSGKTPISASVDDDMNLSKDAVKDERRKKIASFPKGFYREVIPNYPQEKSYW